MPANKILFADYPSHPKPRRVYIDSNFAIRLLVNYVAQPTQMTTKAIEARNCDNFYRQLIADGVEIVGSVFTFAETLHYYSFRYPNGMYQLSRNYLSSHGLSPVGSPHENFKQFLRVNRNDCELAWRSISHRVDGTERFFNLFNIRILHPLPSPQLTNRTGDVARLATLLMDYFVGIESTDAFHLSIAHYLNSDAVVSLDSGFCDVDSYTVYALV